MSTKKTAVKKQSSTLPITPRPKPLDDKTSALVLAEFLVLGEVKGHEMAFLETSGPTPLSNRQIAITFRIADVLGIPCAFEMAPRFRDVFAMLRARLAEVKEAA